MRARLAQAISTGRAALGDEPIRWVRAETLHLTLRFLGEASPSILDQVRQAAGETAASWPAFELRLRGLGCFPDSRQPRVIWAGAEEVSGTLAAVAAALEQIAIRFGFPAERRKFSAHLTIGRVKDRLSPEGSQRLAAWIERSGSESFGTVAVSSIELLKSDLLPSGPVYTRLATLALSSGGMAG